MTPREYIPAGEGAPVVENGAMAAAFWREHVVPAASFPLEVEWVVILLLGADRRLLGYLAPESDASRLYVQTPLRRMLRSALLTNAAGVMQIHNHLGGPLEPSDKDIQNANECACWLEQLGMRLFDSVIVDASCTRWHSMAESGHLAVRADVIEGARSQTYESALNDVLECVTRAHSQLRALVDESAELRGVSPAQWLADFLLERLQQHFHPAAVEDRRLALASAFLRSSPESLAAASEESRRAGVGLSEFIWAEALTALRRRFPAPAPAQVQEMEIAILPVARACGGGQ